MMRLMTYSLATYDHRPSINTVQ